MHSRTTFRTHRTRRAARAAAAVAAGALALSLTACSGSDDDGKGGGDSSGSPTTNTVALPKLDGAHLEIAAVWTGAEQANFKKVLAEFEKRTGRPLLPYLPVLVLDDSNQVFAFEAQLTRQIRHDFWGTVSALFNRHHLRALRDWAHGLDMTLRSQPYGLQTDAIESAAILDIAEGESLGFKNLDDYRCLAGGRRVTPHLRPLRGDRGGHGCRAPRGECRRGGCPGDGIRAERHRAGRRVAGAADRVARRARAGGPAPRG